MLNPPNLASKELTKITLIHHKMKGRKFEKKSSSIIQGSNRNWGHPIKHRWRNCTHIFNVWHTIPFAPSMLRFSKQCKLNVLWFMHCVHKLSWFISWDICLQNYITFLFSTISNIFVSTSQINMMMHTFHENLLSYAEYVRYRYDI